MADIRIEANEQLFKGLVIRCAVEAGRLTSDQIADAVNSGDIDGLPITLADAWEGYQRYLHAPQRYPSPPPESPTPLRDSAKMAAAKRGFVQGFAESMGVEDE